MIKLAVLLAVVLFSLTSCSPVPAPQQKQAEQTPSADGIPSPAVPPQPAANSEQAGLPVEITEAIQQFDGQAGLYAKNLKTGHTIQVNGDSIFPTASTHKLFVALAVYKYLYSEASPAKKQQYDREIQGMIVTSDNPSFDSLVDEIEHTKPNALSQVLADLGLTKTMIHNKEAFQRYGYHSVTTPAEAAVVIETIYNEQYLGKDMSSILKEELAHTIYNKEIPRFMQNIKVMHKTGELPGVMCDLGIVDDGRDQILISIYTAAAKSNDEASNLIAQLSAYAYDHLRTK